MTYNSGKINNGREGNGTDTRKPLHLLAGKLGRKGVSLKTMGRTAPMSEGAALMNEVSKHLWVVSTRDKMKENAEEIL